MEDVVGRGVAATVGGVATVEAVGLGAATVSDGKGLGAGLGVGMDAGVAMYVGVGAGASVAVSAGAVVDAGVGARVAVIGTAGVGVLLASGWAQATSNSTAPNKKMKDLRKTFCMARIVPESVEPVNARQEATAEEQPPNPFYPPIDVTSCTSG